MADGRGKADVALERSVEYFEVDPVVFVLAVAVMIAAVLVGSVQWFVRVVVGDMVAVVVVAAYEKSKNLHPNWKTLVSRYNLTLIPHLTLLSW